MIYYQPGCSYYYGMSLLVLKLAAVRFRSRGAGMGDGNLHQALDAEQPLNYMYS